MSERHSITVDGNEAAASVAYRTNEVIAVYPITPSTPMGELSDEWSTRGRENVWGGVPRVTEMQAEGGAAGAVHGALQAGALTTTFTASQGLLLMIPNMYKIAGELTSFCLHVAARSVATHALSIFGDHSDVMACRQTGFALLASGSVQEAQDMACIGQAATLETRVPFLHFFDGFRVSHEIAKIDALEDDQLRAMIDESRIAEHRSRALSPDRPVLRGTAQNPDTFFQAREASNRHYEACPGKVAGVMDRFAAITGRRYELFQYEGHPEAERVVVMMGSGAETAHETLDWLLERGERVGLLKVRLYRPFSAEHLLSALPPSVRSIAVLDRTKEPGAVGDPLYLDVVTALREARQQGTSPLAHDPTVVGGRYGLSSKELTPAMCKAVWDELDETEPRAHFTVGIVDDVTHMSLPWDPELDIEPDDVVRAVFHGLGADGTVGANKNSIKIIGGQTDHFAQGYFVYDSKKSGAVTTSHLRFGPRPIRSSYLIRRASFVACHQWDFLERLDVLEHADRGAVFLVNAPGGADELWDRLPKEVQEHVLDKDLEVWAIDAYRVAEEVGLRRRINTIMQTCFFAISGVLPADEAIAHIKVAIEKSYGKRGKEVVRQNFLAVDRAVENLRRVEVPEHVTATRGLPPLVPGDAPDFVQKVTALMMSGMGDLLPVSAFPVDGTWPTGTGKYEKRNIAREIPIWDPDICIQCNKCAMVCPHATIRAKVYDPESLDGAPRTFQHREFRSKELTGLEYTIQVAPEDCTGCTLCVEVCPAKDKANPRRKAINMEPQREHRDRERDNWDFFLELPEIDRSRVKLDMKGSQLLEPLFEFSGACAGCGETPYLKLLTQLFGDRLLIANATGCSSIYGGNLPTTPYTTNAQGRGPAWSNSLFEDNAEFGLGFRLAIDQHVARARALVEQVAAEAPELFQADGEDLAAALLGPRSAGRREPGMSDGGREARAGNAGHGDGAGTERTAGTGRERGTAAPGAETSVEEDLAAQRRRVAELRRRLEGHDSPAARRLRQLADYLVDKSVWIVGGDGWAYDIGYGGLDHVLSLDRNVNVLVLDTEVYSNTGGQQSKATPLGASAKFAVAGKEIAKKDIGMMAMAYGNVYIARVAFGASDRQTVKAFLEAETYPGPSLILAYSPCIAHGYDLAHNATQQKLAVESGHWPLLRFDPRRIAAGETPLVLDSRAPSRSLEEFARNETRFRMVERQDPERYRRLMAAAQREATGRFGIYEQLAGLTYTRGAEGPPPAELAARDEEIDSPGPAGH